MNPDSIKVRFGELDDVIGPARRFDDISIVPARVQLTGSMLTNGPHLDQYLQAHDLSANIKALIRPGEDAPWACGRIQRVFSLPQLPEEERTKNHAWVLAFLRRSRKTASSSGFHLSVRTTMGGAC